MTKYKLLCSTWWTPAPPRLLIISGDFRKAAANHTLNLLTALNLCWVLHHFRQLKFLQPDAQLADFILVAPWGWAAILRCHSKDVKGPVVRSFQGEVWCLAGRQRFDPLSHRADPINRSGFSLGVSSECNGQRLDLFQFGVKKRPDAMDFLVMDRREVIASSHFPQGAFVLFGFKLDRNQLQMF